MSTSLYELLQLCTAKICIKNDSSRGTGFFVSNRCLITCAHILKGHDGSKITVSWQGQISKTVKVIKAYKSPVDLALLSIYFSPQIKPPCVLLDDSVTPFDQLYAYGYSDYFPDGSSISVRCEGSVSENNLTLVKVKSGQIRPGHSGAPALNNKTGKVCGLVCQTRNRSTDMGGLLIPTATIFSYFPEIRTLNQNTVNQEQRWLELLSHHLIPEGSEILNDYRERETKRHASLKLPLLNHSGKFISLPIETLYVDLPLMLNYSPVDEEETTLVEIENAQWMLRESFTSALLFDRAVRIQSSTVEKTTYRIESQIQKGSRLVIIGDPGCGKTTLLSYIAHTYIAQKRWTPITLTCRDLIEASQTEGLIGLIHYQLRQTGYSRDQIQTLSNVFEKQIAANRILLLVDGLDEIPTEAARWRFSQFLSAQAQLHHDMPIILTSRVVGFRSIQSALGSFKHFTVAPLSVNDRKQFLESWATLVSKLSVKQNRAKTLEQLEHLVGNNRKVAKLCENVFLLGLIVQMFSLDGSLPTYRIDIYRRAIELIIARQRKGLGPPLVINEVYPYLEHLAYCMRSEGDQYWSEAKVLAAIEEVQQVETEEPDLQRRSPNEWLNAAIDQLGILNVAGSNKIDNHGYERRVIQFFHQSFQEYFAAQAIAHGRGDYTQLKNNQSDNLLGVGILERLRQQVHGLDIVERKIESLGAGVGTEPVAAGHWQEVVRFCISELSSYDKWSNGLLIPKHTIADDAMQMLLPSSDESPREARALSVFALQCLVEVPKLSAETVRAVFESAVCNFKRIDGFNAKRNTLMDEAVYAVMHSSYGSQWRNQLLELYIQSKDMKRNRIGCILAMAGNEILAVENAERVLTPLLDQLSATNPTGVRVEASLKLTELFYKDLCSAENNVTELLPERLMSRILNILLRTAIENPAGNAVSTAAIWALGWLTSARIGNAYTLQPLTSSELASLRAIISNEQQDAFARSWAAEVISVCSPSETVFGQADWIYEWAVVADGEQPHSLLPKVTMSTLTQDIEAIATLLAPSLPISVRSSGAISLGRLGYFTTKMVDPLLEVFRNDLFIHTRRTEALVYLTCLKEPKAITAIAENINVPKGIDDTYDIPAHCFLAAIGMGNVDVFNQLLNEDSIESLDLNACAYTLAGIESTDGRKLLKSLLSHRNSEVRRAASVGTAKAIQWGLLKESFLSDQLSRQVNNIVYKVTQWPLSQAGFAGTSGNVSFSSHVDKQIAARGHEIHKLKARDSAGRWCYYFVLVEPRKEKRFLEALESNRLIDLENYGKVIGSCLGEEPSTKLKKNLREKYGFIL